MYVGFGTVFFDVDRDGDEDLSSRQGTSCTRPEMPPSVRPRSVRDLKAQKFVNIASQAGTYISTPHMGRGVAVGDVDGDGDLDLAISHTNEPISVLANESRSRPHWFAVQLIGVPALGMPLGLAWPSGPTAADKRGRSREGAVTSHPATAGFISVWATPPTSGEWRSTGRPAQRNNWAKCPPINSLLSTNPMRLVRDAWANALGVEIEGTQNQCMRLTPSR